MYIEVVKVHNLKQTFQKQFERFPFQSNMAAAFKLSGIAAANQTETNVVITMFCNVLALSEG